MFLRKLVIRSSGTLIREINFIKGINLIIDETPASDKTESGNSVGKTTVLRLIDFCLGGSGKNIYIDPEFKTKNSTVESFLTKPDTFVELSLCKDLENSITQDIVIKRNFLRKHEKFQAINGEPLSNDKLLEELKYRLFPSNPPELTLRQLISKNIRDEKNKITNTIRVLPQNVTTDATYEALHLFWFGISTGKSKDTLVRDLNNEKRLQKRLRRNSNLSQVQQALILVNAEILKLETNKKSFHIADSYEKDLSDLRNVKAEIAELSVELSRIILRRQLINESTTQLEGRRANSDARKVALIYKQAKKLIPELQKTFEETLKFHNEFLEERINFVRNELPDLIEEINSKQLLLEGNINFQRELEARLENSRDVRDLRKMDSELNDFYERKGALEEQKGLWVDSNQKISNLEGQIKIINDAIDSQDSQIQQRIAKFNEIFSNISNKLDGELSLLSADKVNDIYRFEIGNIEGNPGTGGKKSQMASFDLSYIKYADMMNIDCLHFVLQDQIENVHSNQISQLLSTIVQQVNCQYVLPVLRDKLPIDVEYEKYKVLTLSSKSKLFKV